MKGIFSSLGSWAKKRAENRKQTLENLPPPVLSDKALKVIVPSEDLYKAERRGVMSSQIVSVHEKGQG